ncbi:MAG: TonB-dependent receptor [Flavobacteriaceae bacterium]|nr:TonB-dependent receptor [Flavobacteriaceae bacterium]
MGKNVNMFKLRGGWAQVGNDTNPYNLVNVYGDAGQWGDATRLTKPSGLLNSQLESELATSIEFGADIKMFGNRLRFEGTYYTVDNENQILSIPLAASTGFNRRTINAGLLQSKGWEILLGGTPIKTENWTWNVDMNFTRTRAVIKELDDNAEFVNFWSSEKVRSVGYVEGYSNPVVDNGAIQDGLLGNLYGNAIRRVKDENSPYFGYPILGTGFSSNYTVEDELTKMGNYNPDFILGLQTSLTYKNFTLDMTFDWRSGGQYVSGTWRRFVSAYVNQEWFDQAVNPGELSGGPSPELKQWVLDNADQLLFADRLRPVGGPTLDSGGFPESFSGVEVSDGFFAPGVFDNGDGTYTENLGEQGTVFLPFAASMPWDVSRNAIFDADYIKLREISLSYRLDNKIANKAGLQNVNFSVYSRNIMLWTKSSKFGVDPENAYRQSGSGFRQGIEFYNVNPWVIPIGFKVGFTF